MSRRTSGTRPSDGRPSPQSLPGVHPQSSKRHGTLRVVFDTGRLRSVSCTPEVLGCRPELECVRPGFAAAFGLLSALHYRQRTGKGQVIDVSHFEATSKAMVGLLDYAINRRIQQPMGNKDARFAPQGCYPCKGDDKWVVITIASERDWLEFIKVLNNPEWAYDSRYATTDTRKEYHEELDKLIGAWTCQHDNYEIMRLLQEVGIAAAPVLESGELLKDPHFEARGFYETSVHAYTGTKLLPGTAYKMSRTEGGTRWSAPLFGEHNDYVFKNLLGLSDAKITELAQKGIIGTEPSYARG